MRCFLLIYCLCHIALSQNEVRHFNSSTGLAHDVTYGLFQDSKGHIWIGTDDGLMKFNGHTFKTFTIDDGLRTNYVIDIVEDAENTIVISTWGGGLHFIKNDSVLRHRLPENYHLQSKNIQVYKDQIFSNFKDENIFYKRGVNSYEQECFEIKKNNDKPYMESVREIPNSLGNISVIDSKLYAYDSQTLEYPSKKLLKGVYLINDSHKFIPVFPFLRDYYIDNIFKLSEEYIASSENKILIFNKTKLLKTYDLDFKNRLIVEVKETIEGDLLLLAADKNGFKEAYLFNPVNEKLINLRKKYAIGVTISDLIIDHEQNIWLSTFGEGVYCIKNNLRDIKFIGKETLINTDIQGVVEKDGAIYILNPNQVIILKKQQKIKSINLHAFGKSIMNYKDSIIVNSLGESIFHDGIMEMRQASMFDVDSLGLIIYSDSLIIPKMKKVLTNPAERIINNRDALFYKDTLLFATERGLFYGDLKKNMILKKEIDPPLLSSQLHDFQKVHNGLFIASLKGLDYISDTKRAFYTEKEGLINNNINVLTLDHRGDLWIGTSKGVSVFDGENFTSLGKNEGLLSSHANVIFEDSNHQVWICGSDGISILNNAAPFKKTNPPLLNIVQNPSDFQYNTISYNRPKSLITQYKINDGDWITLQSNSGVFPIQNFKEGIYSLQFRARKRDSNWKTSKVFNFNITLPWYQHAFFYFMLGVLLFGVITFFILRTLKKEKTRNHTLYQAITKQKELEKELHTVRTNIAQDFHDDMGNKLARITLFSNMLIKETKDKENLTKKLKYIVEDANYLYKGSRDFVFSLKENSNYLEELTTYLSDFGEDLFKNTDINFLVYKELSQNEKLPHYWSKQLIYIFKEALTNVLKHSQAINAKLTFTYKGSTLIISCIDDGKGFSEKEIKVNNGLQHMQQRAEKIQGVLKIESIKGVQTLVTFKGGTT